MASRIPVLLLIAVWCSVCVAANNIDISKSELRSLLIDILRYEHESTSAPCEDTSIYQDCHRVVKERGGFCTRGLHYAHYCCRSCLNAGQVDRFGPHTAKGVKAPLVADVDHYWVVVQRGDDVNLRCVASGYPSPEVGWFSPTGAPIHSGSKYQITGHYEDTPLVRTVESTLKVRNFSHDDAGTYRCLAVTPHDNTPAMSMLFDPGQLRWVRRSLGQFVDVGEPMILECVAKAAVLPTIVWKFNGHPISDHSNWQSHVDPEQVIEFVNSTGQDEKGLVTVYSSLRVNSSDYRHEGQYTCLAHNVEATEEWTLQVSIKDASSLAPNCTDVNREECNRATEVRGCNHSNYLPRYCCRTCTLAEELPTTGSHLQHVSKDMSPSLSITGDYDGGNYLGTATVNCSVEGIPNGLTLAWTKDTVTLENSPKYTIEEIPTDCPYFTRTLSLYIHTLTLADAGIYTCTATAPASTPAASSMVLRFNWSPPGFRSDNTFGWRNRATEI